MQQAASEPKDGTLLPVEELKKAQQNISNPEVAALPFMYLFLDIFRSRRRLHK